MKRSSLLLFAFIFEGGALVLGLSFSKIFSVPLLLIPMTPIKDIALGVAWASIPFVFFIFLVSSYGQKVPFIRDMRKLMLKGIHSLFLKAGILDIIVIAFLAGLGEEVLFRGAIQGKFGIIIASVLFGLAHAITPAYVIIAAIMGIYIGLLYEHYNSLFLVIQLHFIYDLGALLWLKHLKAPNGAVNTKRTEELSSE